MPPWRAVLQRGGAAASEAEAEQHAGPALAAGSWMSGLNFRDRETIVNITTAVLRVRSE